MENKKDELKKMYTLKTLDEIENKEFISKNDLGYIQAKEDIKYEAIKWIKHIEGDIEVIKNLELDRNIPSPLRLMVVNGLDKELGAQIVWIKMFFNISEEDLTNRDKKR